MDCAEAYTTYQNHLNTRNNWVKSTSHPSKYLSQVVSYEMFIFTFTLRFFIIRIWFNSDGFLPYSNWNIGVCMLFIWHLPCKWWKENKGLWCTNFCDMIERWMNETEIRENIHKKKGAQYNFANEDTQRKNKTNFR